MTTSEKLSRSGNVGIIKRFFRRFRSKKTPQISVNQDTDIRIPTIEIDTKSKIPESVQSPVEIAPEIALPVEEQESSSIFIGETKDDQEIIIGFDLGTSCSKVIIRDPQRNIAYAVDFGENGHHQNTLLLPTQIYLNKKNIFDLHNGEHKFSEIKLNLIDNPDDVIFNNLTNTDIAIAYLGIALKLVRSWFFSTLSNIYENNNIIWQINIGMPARDYSNAALVNLFKYVALLGWEIPLIDSDVTRDSVQRLSENVQGIDQCESAGLSLHPDDVAAIPEIIAAVVGYAKSRMRKDGMYFLMDVGASTVDVSMFNLFIRQGELKYSILWAEIGRYGVLSQLKIRLNGLPAKMKEKIKSELHLEQCVDPIPDISQLLPDQYEHHIRVADIQMSTKLRNLIGRVITKVKKDQNPYDPNWKKGVPLFVTGGGSEIEFYRDLLIYKINDLANMHIGQSYFVDLPDPADLKIDQRAPSVIKRFSSAYGLSYRESDIGEIQDAGSIEAISKCEFKVDYSDRYIGKEMT